MCSPRIAGFALVALLCARTGVLCAQGRPESPVGPRYALDDSTYRNAVADLYWQWLGAAPCQAAPWEPSTGAPAVFDASVRPLRSAFDRRLGHRGTARAGAILERREISGTARYRVEFIQHTGRLAPTRFRGYLVRPEGAGPTPAVILVHGAGTLPRQALGWSYGRAEAVAYAGAPIRRLAADLAEAGYAVFVPWIREDFGDVWPNLPWPSLDRAGEHLRVKRGGSGLGLAVGQLEAVTDLLLLEDGIDSTSIAAVGWEEGADIVAAHAAVDPRVRAVVRMMPPLDRRALRASPPGLRANPGFVQIDCTYAEPELAALIAPRPMLHDWSPADATYPRHQAFVDTTVADQGRAFYAAKGMGGGITLAGTPVTGTARAVRIIDWLDAALAHRPRRIVPSGEEPPLPRDAGSLRASLDSVVVYTGSAIALMGTCPRPALPTPPTQARATFIATADRWRRAIASDLRVPRPADRTPRIVSRDTLEKTPEFTLEWIVTEPTQTGLPLMGLLASPARAVGDAPMLLTFDGDFSAGEPFALGPAGRTAYLKGYARDAAAEGVVVFAPTIPAWFGEAASTILAARDPNGKTMWGTVLGQVRAATDLLLAQPATDSSRLTIQGISWAGFIALYGAALDTRITTLVYSNPINTADSLFTDPVGAQLSSWYAPICGTMNIAQRWLIAPRRFIWENGIGDDNGYEGRPLEAARDVQRVYEELGIGDRFDLLRHGGGHEEAPRDLRALDPYRRRFRR